MSGVPQGTALAPLLFVWYINDLPKKVSSKVRLYANDIFLYNTIHTKKPFNLTRPQHSPTLG